MVVDPAHHPAAPVGGHSHLHRQLGHRLGALSLSLIHDRAAQYSWFIGVLP